MAMEGYTKPEQIAPIVPAVSEPHILPTNNIQHLVLLVKLEQSDSEPEHPTLPFVLFATFRLPLLHNGTSDRPTRRGTMELCKIALER
jgi:hypothetical protein